MNPTSYAEAIRAVKGQGVDTAPPLKLISLAWRSALLNLTIVLTAFPVLAFAGGPGAVVPALALMAAISAILWSATLTAFFMMRFVRACTCLSARRAQRSHGRANAGGVLADRWLDNPA
jgi:hypothetical protein